MFQPTRIQISIGVLVPMLLVASLWKLNLRRLDFALLIAASNPNTKRIVELVEKGANVNTRQEKGNTPLHNAALVPTNNS